MRAVLAADRLAVNVECKEQLRGIDGQLMRNFPGFVLDVRLILACRHTCRRRDTVSVAVESRQDLRVEQR
jgi:hypothetical protein